MFGLLCVLGAGVSAQQVTVKGKVLDGNDQTPLVGAGYVVVGQKAGGLTGDGGEYSVTVPRADEIQIVFRYMGYNDTTLTVATEAGKNDYEVDMLLGGSGLTMKTEVITAGRHKQDLAKVVTSMDVISPEKVDLQATNDIEDALQQGSGVDIIDGQPNIRGSSGFAYGVGSRVMLMLDGLPLLSADASFPQFDIIPTDNLAQIEIMKGASSVLYGSSALGGVINVITADAPDTARTTLRMRGTLYGAPRDPLLDWDGDANAKAGAINVSHARKIGNHDLTVMGGLWKETGYRAHTDAEQGRLMAMTKFRPKGIPGLSFGVNASARFDSSGTMLFWDSYLPADTLFTFGGDTIFNSQGAYSGLGSRRRQLNTRFTVDPFIKYLTPKNNIHQYRGRWMRTKNTNDTNQSNKNAVVYNDYQFTTRIFGGRVTWVTGATAQINFANGDSLYGALIVDTLTNDTTFAGGSYRSINGAVYSQMDIAVTPKLQASIGARYDLWRIDGGIVYGVTTEQSPIFRAGLNYELFQGTNFRASFGQAFRSPSVAERFTSTNAGALLIRPNPDLKVEKGWSAEIGIRQGFLAGDKKRNIIGFVDVAGFMMDYDNMIEFGVKPPDVFIFPPPNPEFQARNVQDARITGIEATTLVQVTYDKLHFSLNGGITYIDPVNLNPADSLVDLLNTVGPQDAPFTGEAFGMFVAMTAPADDPRKKTDNPRFLKYRSRWTNRFSATVGYDRFSLTANYRYKSVMESIDQFLYIAIPGSADWDLAHRNGFTIVDFILGVDLIKGMKMSFHLENAFNEEWAILPGLIGEQRHYSVQLKYVF